MGGYFLHLVYCIFPASPGIIHCGLTEHTSTRSLSRSAKTMFLETRCPLPGVRRWEDFSIFIPHQRTTLCLSGTRTLPLVLCSTFSGSGQTSFLIMVLAVVRCSQAARNILP